MQGDYAEARRLYRQSLQMREQLGDVAEQANSLGQLGSLAYEQGDFEQALTYTVQALLLFEMLHAPNSSIAWRMIARIRAQMDEATFLAHWRALAGNLPVPAPQEQSQQEHPQQEEGFLTKLNTLCNEVVVALRSGDATQQGALADRLEQMAMGDLPLEEARGFLRLLVGWLRGQDSSALLPQAEQLSPPFRNTFVQMIAIVQQEETPSSMTLKDVLTAVGNALLHGTSEKREQIATSLVGLQQQLPPSEAALGKFLACLTAALRGEAPDLTSLEAPFTELWQQFQQALQTRSSEQDQQESE